MSSPTANITSVLKESRLFSPTGRVRGPGPQVKSLAEYERLWQRRQGRPRGLLERTGRGAALVPALDPGAWNGRKPHAQWFVGGRLNVS